MEEFVTSLQGALHEAAVDFYREHARRVRRKRSRYPPPQSLWQPIAAAAKALNPSAPDPYPLAREGWHVRAEVKLATFAELAGDLDTALQHYLEARDMLASSRCLGSTSMLPPRTKRWAEAKVLVDTINIRICRLHMYLYANSISQGVPDGIAVGNPALLASAMNGFQRHVKRFSELSFGWGIGDETFEYWSWLSKQYRMLADLIDAATRPSDKHIDERSPSFLQLPLHAPPLPSNLLPSSIATGTNAPTSIGPLFAPSATALAEGTVPLSYMPDAGYLYFLAGICTIERRNRFKKMIDNGEGQDEKASGYPALMHEKTVNHTTQISEVSQMLPVRARRSACAD